MSYASHAVDLLNCFAKANFPDNNDWPEMARMLATGDRLDCFDHDGIITHKYLNTESMNADLGLLDGAGIFQAVRFSDGSLMLMTCNNGLAVHDAIGTYFPEYPKWNTHP